MRKDEHTSKRMLYFHLNNEVVVSSHNAAFIDKSVELMISYFKLGTGTKIADFGCGPEMYRIKLTKLQSDVTEIDISKYR